MPEVIDSFRDKYRFLSNFYTAEVVFDGARYPSVEHAYQAAKTLNYDERDQIRVATTAGIAKKLGRKVTMRKDWEEIKLAVMRDLVWQKFERHPENARKLLDTGDATLIEGNWWGDKFWGVCDGEGENHLGKILMNIREDLRHQEAFEEWYLGSWGREEP